MFSKIPTKFSAPFGLLGDEAKLAFPSQSNGILKLANVRVRIRSYQKYSNAYPRWRAEYITIGFVLGTGWRSQFSDVLFFALTLLPVFHSIRLGL